MAAEQTIEAPDGRTWVVSTCRVGVPAPIGLIGALAWLVGRLYHFALHRGRWRVEALEVVRLRDLPKKSSTIWELGVYDEAEARRVAAKVAADLANGWAPGT